MQRLRNPLLSFLFFLALLLPWLIFVFLPSGIAGHALFWLAIFFCLLLIWVVSDTQRHLAAAAGPDLGPRMLNETEQPEAVRQVMDVKIAIKENGLQVFRGPLRDSPSASFEKLNRALPKGLVPLVREDEQLGAKIVLITRSTEKDISRKPVRPWLHWVLFGLTIITTTWAGARHQGVDLAQEPGLFIVGLPYAIGLLLILGVHELGHFFMARRHAMDVTPPYFIPVPFGLGTFGAFIQMRSPPANRNALFDVAVAGPLAGFVIAVPALLLGLRSSSITASGDGTLTHGFLHGATVGSSILFAVLTRISLGDAAQYGALVQLSPLAFAGWLGLFITALNLLPVGQLDGGHITRAMFGSRIGQTISSVAMWSLFLLALFVWPGLMMWALIVFLIAGRGAPPLNDLTPLDAGRMVVGYLAILILILILAPMPHSLWDSASDICPYL
ncbi:MAG: site-2 protease family protein [Verrucomicrobia bacterium]|nr:site-2 protease family protein [Verrucomicrobiota bacterium]MBV9644196.1 site-2 protease family protein [Verrucomicrobiota bacterium]